MREIVENQGRLYHELAQIITNVNLLQAKSRDFALYEMHRNSQKRIILEDSIYFITTNTYNSYPYFKNYNYCDILKADIHLVKDLKNFDLFAYKINPDHIHLLLKPGENANISEIMRSLKTNSSRNINRVINFNPKRRLKQFKWQKSFNDHIIRDDRDFMKHTEYIANQWIKHNLQRINIVSLMKNFVGNI